MGDFASRDCSTLRYVLLAGSMLITIVPFIWMAVGSMSSTGDLYRFPPSIPSVLHLENYSELFSRFPFAKFSFNSAKIATLATAGTLLCSTLAAYAFARMEFKGRRILFWLAIGSMMVPFQVTMVPVFVMLRALGMVGHHSALIIPHYFGFGMGAFGIFLMHQFFRMIPRDIEDAARIDGAGRFAIYFRILLPLAKPALATLSVLTFMAHWNDLIGPVLYLSGTDSLTLTVGLAALQGGDLASRVDLVLAGSVISVIPILVLFLVAQRVFIRGITAGGVKA